VEADFQQYYGLDLSSPGMLTTHTARWLQARVTGLLTMESRLRIVTDPPKKKEGSE
jgi:hypothetical protein